MLEHDFKPGFKASVQQKDLRIVMEEAHRLGLMLPAAAATAQVFNALVGNGLGEADSIAVLKLLEKIVASKNCWYKNMRGIGAGYLRIAVSPAPTFERTARPFAPEGER